MKTTTAARGTALIILFVLLALVALNQSSSPGLPGASPGLNAYQGTTQSAPFAFPLKDGSVRFAMIGDNGTGDSYENDVAQQMVQARTKFPFDFTVMLGDNIYGGHSPNDFVRKFEQPYQALLSAGVKFYASLGNHDDPIETFYKPFNMGGQRYYAYSKGNVRFFVLDSNYMDPVQYDWLQKELSTTTSAWKIAYFHHPLYSDARFHGPDTDLRARIEPLFLKYGVNIVLSGHEHVYERIQPQHGIYYFTLGNAGELRFHDLRKSSATIAGFDEDRCFMIVEIAGDEFYFETISRTGKVVDSGVLERQQKAAPATSELRLDKFGPGLPRMTTTFPERRAIDLGVKPMQRAIWIAIALFLFLPGCGNYQSGTNSNGNADAERARQQRQIYQDRAEAKLHELDRQIEELKEKITSDKHHEHKDLEPQLDDLQRKRDVAHDKLEKFRSSSQAAWEDMKTGMDSAMDDLQTAFKRADSHFSQ